MSGGHYTAYCKNFLNNKWFEFDDESIYIVAKDDDEDKIRQHVVSRAAYVLFYKLRK